MSIIKRPSKEALCILSVATVLVIVWFRKGLMIGAGESALPFYNNGKQLLLSSSTWSAVALGFVAPQVVSGLPFFFLVRGIEALGTPPFLTQAVLFWLILVVGGLSVYLLTSRAYPASKLAALVGGLFYILNPFAMTTVWHRFQYTFMFAYALLPLSLILYVEGLRRRKIEYAFYIGGVSAIWALAFAEPPFIGTFWLILLSYFVFELVVSPKGRSHLLYSAKFLAVIFSTWTLVNGWWLFALVAVAPSIITSIASAGQLGTLLAISEQSKLIFVLRMINPFYTYTETSWGTSFSSPFFELSACLIPIFVFSSLLVRKRVNGLSLYLAVLAVVSVFLAKGAAQPLGQLFILVFSGVPPLQIFRNPFEKLGILLPLAYAPLFGIGVAGAYHAIKEVLNRRVHSPSHLFANHVAATLLVALVLFSTIGVYVWPMWTGRVFNSPYPPTNNPEIGYNVDIPSYYRQANDWLLSTQGTYRIIVLPMTAEGITYTWKNGYSGVELSNQLFDHEAISYNAGSPFAVGITQSLESSLLRTNQFWKLMGILNSKFVLVRSDVDYNARLMTPPSIIKRGLNYTTLPVTTNGVVDVSSPEVRNMLGDAFDPALWSVVWIGSSAAYQFKADTTDLMQSNYSVVLQGSPLYRPSTNDSLTGFYWHTTSDGQGNWTGRNYIDLWLQSDLPGKLYLEIDDNFGNGINFDGRVQSTYSFADQETNSWKLFTLPLNLPTISTPSRVDFGNVKRVLVSIVLDGNRPESTLKLGGVFLDYGSKLAVEGITYVKSFGPLDFYELSDAYFTPRIYAVGQHMLFRNLDEFIWDAIPKANYDPRSTLALLKTQIGDLNVPSDYVGECSSRANVSFERVTASNWIVHAQNPCGPYFLVFSETYHRDWKAYYGRVDWFTQNFAQPIAEDLHLVGNGYANAWYVNRTGNYTITLLFGPQALMNYGALASAGMLLVFVPVIGQRFGLSIRPNTRRRAICAS